MLVGAFDRDSNKGRNFLMDLAGSARDVGPVMGRPLLCAAAVSRWPRSGSWHLLGPAAASVQGGNPVFPTVPNFLLEVVEVSEVALRPQLKRHPQGRVKERAKVEVEGGSFGHR